MSSFPAVFVSHGAPDLPLSPSPAREFLKGLGAKLGKPEAILMISAHWNTQKPIVSAAPQPRTIHDFGGFPGALYQMEYPAPGAPDLAKRVAILLGADLHPSRGLDHGAWVPLILMYPEAEIPVTQLSIQPHRNPEYHFQLGRAIAPLRDEGVLILASGSATHNLWELGHPSGANPPIWAGEFAHWLEEAVVTGKTEDLLNYRRLAPFAQQNHPTEEHLLPLFVALGAGGGSNGNVLHNSFTYTSLSMGVYRFG